MHSTDVYVHVTLAHRQFLTAHFYPFGVRPNSSLATRAIHLRFAFTSRRFRNDTVGSGRIPARGKFRTEFGARDLNAEEIRSQRKCRAERHFSLRREIRACNAENVIEAVEKHLHGNYERSSRNPF